MSDPSKDLKCYGESWSLIDKICKGGLDPAFTNPLAQSPTNPNGDPSIPVHVRPTCVWNTQCAQLTNYNKVRGVMAPPPPNVLPRTQPVNINKPRWQSVHQTPTAPQPKTYQQPTYQQPGWSQQQTYMVPPHVASWGPQMVPMPYQQPGSQMSAYLSVPEPIDVNVPWYWRLLGDMFRSALKAVFHTGAHVADHQTFTRHQPPEQK